MGMAWTMGSLAELGEAGVHSVSRRAREQQVLGSRKAMSPESQKAWLLDAVRKFWGMFYRWPSRKRGVLVGGLVRQNEAARSAILQSRGGCSVTYASPPGKA